MKKRFSASKGFSLAETLITLEIIGIVASLTINVLTTATLEIEQKTRFKKALSIFSQATMKVRADVGYDMGCYYLTSGSTGSECVSFWNKFISQFNIIKQCSGSSYANGCIPLYSSDYTLSGSCGGFSHNSITNTNPSFVLSDGTILIPYGSVYATPLLAVDINGDKPPNKMGYDVFEMRWQNVNNGVKLTSYGYIFPESGGKTSAQMLQDAFK